MKGKGKEGGRGEKEEEKKRGEGGKEGRGYLFRRGMGGESRLERRQGSHCPDRMGEG